MSDEIKKGLLGIVVDETEVSKVMPEINSLTYRGYAAQDLCAKCKFEEVAYLILNGELPSKKQLKVFDKVERKQWKLSKMDLESRIRWEDYTKAKEEMFYRTNIPEAPWYIVEGDDKKRERLNCIEHILSLVPYKEIQHETITLPERVFTPDYERRVLPDKLYVPKIY